jgi:RimJ/RimL family protein N-acetyltransferase
MSRATTLPEGWIETGRLVLRPARRSDVDVLVREISDFEVSKMLARVPYPYRRRDAESFLAATGGAGGDLSLAITLDDRLIGGIGLSGVRREHEFGYWLGRAHWGKGYATEAGRAFLVHVFEAFTLDVVRSGVFVGNAASLRVQEKLGFEQIGTRRVHCLARRRRLDHIDTLLTRRRFAALVADADPA